VSGRRFFLKNGLLAIAGIVGATGLAGKGNGVANGEAKGSPKKYGLIIDLNRCIGCQSCVIACKAQNQTAVKRFCTRVLIGEDGSYPDSRVIFTPIQCNQCENPPCIPACPIKATFKLPNGIVVTDWEKCKGIGTCVKACPYGARFLDPRFGNKVDKCDFCINRLEQSLLPACVEACSPRARIFGDFNAPEREFVEYLKRADLVGRKPELGLKTSILYVPSQKSGKGRIP
jgi:Fe-S-cluster-containing dehydrogenase component